MKISLRKKIFLQFLLFMVVNGLIWLSIFYFDHMLKQKIQIIDKKNNLLNTILEARRYEKNFFLNGDPAHLDQAVAYIVEAGEKFRRIVQEHGKYTLTRNFKGKEIELQAYRDALTTLAQRRKNGDATSAEAIQPKIGALGRKITEDIDQIVREERKEVNQLLNRSQIGLLGSMGALVLLSVLTTLFLFVNVNAPLKAIEDGDPPDRPGRQRQHPGGDPRRRIRIPGRQPEQHAQ